MLGQVTTHLPLTRIVQCFHLWQLATAWLIFSNEASGDRYFVSYQHVLGMPKFVQ